MTSPTKDPITCHVLDTQAGRPARGIRVRLEGPIPPSTNPHSAAQPRPNTFESMTDDDGRVTAWLPYLSEDVAGEPPLQTLVEVLEDRKGQENTFFPEVTVTFRVEEGQTYHVPLLLSPYSYTSYRGS
ncbi:hypothetical protein BFJ67_g3385 [Fusarium oxysporum f. sp. cepae]|nr:hypothetical protein BFJ67_g3385 [Fusarium oxysporum f. sp. cepae]